MLFKNRINNIVTDLPKLSRVWIRTEDARMPLKSVWISDSDLRQLAAELGQMADEMSLPEPSDDHLVITA